MKKIIEIEGMNCSHCTQKVENALYGLPETEEVNINLENKCSEVDFSSDVDDKLISDLIKSIGYLVTNIKNI
ncbi:heavy-metal-associated domain-containing protein [Pseudoleptotrichia goodfellowii]|jgi:Copper chaperone|uniref:Heavy metal-associated domain protein n=2 Tax=Pseudoleptotrichia goodfellowii TaxID=157692 RepID=D0GIH3_9FUSO|nr:heavy metal-associated domain-containing protein [Pseudoleptotrichia goodfellowii]EEY36107.1 heavy metal-associated domain protein [Pseudoleptotrichia goodfellowii F0264]MBF4805045.1 heavy-metal-associated domain-containing protein [Pseudoleptotrichia goodfellowii]BBM35361.1 heavy metal-associated domain protein [Pseudoleptotrichia goodfellowii]